MVREGQRNSEPEPCHSATKTADKKNRGQARNPYVVSFWQKIGEAKSQQIQRGPQKYSRIFLKNWIYTIGRM